MSERDEARAEAAAFAWDAYRRDVGPNPSHFAREAVAFKAGLEAGAGLIAELEAEVADTVSHATDAQALKLDNDRLRAERDEFFARAEAAEAKLAAVRAFCVEHYLVAKAAGLTAW